MGAEAFEFRFVDWVDCELVAQLRRPNWAMRDLRAGIYVLTDEGRELLLRLETTLSELPLLT